MSDRRCSWIFLVHMAVASSIDGDDETEKVLRLQGAVRPVSPGELGIWLTLMASLSACSDQMGEYYGCADSRGCDFGVVKRLSRKKIGVGENEDAVPIHIAAAEKL